MSTRALKAIGCAAAALLLIGCATPFQQAGRSSQILPHERVVHGAGDAAGQYALGKYYLGQGRQALALIAFTKAVELDPSNADARNGRATVLSQFGEHEKAAAELRAAIAIKPDASYLHNNLGYVEYLRGNYMAAAESLRVAFGLEPTNRGVKANWALLVAKASSTPAIAARLEDDRSGERDRLAGAASPSVQSVPLQRPVERMHSDDGVRNLINIGRVDLAARAPASAAAAGDPSDASRLEARTTLDARIAAAADPSGNATAGDTAVPNSSVVNLDVVTMREHKAQPVPASTLIDLRPPRQVSPSATGPAAASAVAVRPVEPIPLSRSAVPTVVVRPVEPIPLSHSAVPTVVMRPVEPIPLSHSAAPTVVVRPRATAAVPTAPVARVVDVAPATVRLTALAPPPRASEAPPAPQPPVVVEAARIEVLNGNGTDRMASKLSAKLRQRGLNVVRIANADTFSIPTTRIYFRDGFMHQALALARQFRKRPIVMISADDDSRADLSVVLGRDQGSRVVLRSRQHRKIAALSMAMALR